MYARNGARTGVGPSQPALSRSRVRIAWTNEQFDGDLYAQPLVDETRVVVATEGGSVYGLDLQTGQQIWRMHVADPANGVQPCANIDPLGITGTPAIDPRTHVVYAVAERADGSHLLAAIDDRDGVLRWQRVVDPPGSNAPNQQQRPALVIANDHVYVALGGLAGDCGMYHGYVVGVPLDGAGEALVYEVPSVNKASIWAPSGPAVGDDGSLYVATGNGISQTDYDHGEALIRLDPALNERGFAAPSDWAFDNAHDRDLGSTGPTLLPGGLVAVGSKDANLHVSAIDRLGGVGGELADTLICGIRNGVYGALAAVRNRVFAPCDDGLVAADVSPDGRATLAWASTTVVVRPPIVAYGTLWAVDILGGGLLHAVDPATGRDVVTLDIGQTRSFTTPSAAQGFVLVDQVTRLVAVRVA